MVKIKDRIASQPVPEPQKPAQSHTRAPPVARETRPAGTYPATLDAFNKQSGITTDPLKKDQLTALQNAGIVKPADLGVVVGGKSDLAAIAIERHTSWGSLNEEALAASLIKLMSDEPKLGNWLVQRLVAHGGKLGDFQADDVGVHLFEQLEASGDLRKLTDPATVKALLQGIRNEVTARGPWNFGDFVLWWGPNMLNKAVSRDEAHAMKALNKLLDTMGVQISGVTVDPEALAPLEKMAQLLGSTPEALVAQTANMRDKTGFLSLSEGTSALAWVQSHASNYPNMAPAALRDAFEQFATQEASAVRGLRERVMRLARGDNQTAGIALHKIRHAAAWNPSVPVSELADAFEKLYKAEREIFDAHRAFNTVLQAKKRLPGQPFPDLVTTYLGHLDASRRDSATARRSFGAWVSEQ